MRWFIFLFALIFSIDNLYAETTSIFVKGDTLYLENIIGAKIKEPIVSNLNFGDSIVVPKEKIRSLLYRLNLLDKYSEYIKDYTVTREGLLLDEVQLKEIIKEGLSKKFPGTVFEVEKISYGNNIYYQNKNDIKVDFVRSNYGSSNIVLNNGYKNYNLYAYIKAYKDALVASRDIRPNEPIKGNVKMEKIEITNNYNNLAKNVEGFMAKRTIRKGEPILTQYIVEKPALKRGSTVRIRYQSKFIMVETKGILKDDAFKDKYLRVKNASSGKLVTAKYIGNDIVLVN